MHIETAATGWSAGHRQLDIADEVVAFSVTDTGIGIPADKHQIIFEAFQQADGTITRKYGGTGLGLSTVYGIVRQSGGHIRLDSEPAKGATFRVYLPRVEQSQPALARGVSGEPEGAAVAREEVRETVVEREDTLASPPVDALAELHREGGVPVR